MRNDSFSWNYANRSYHNLPSTLICTCLEQLTNDENVSKPDLRIFVINLLLTKLF